MRLPEIAEELHRLAEDFSIPRLHFLADEIGRRKGKRSPPTSTPMTPALRRQIILAARLNPEMSQLEIAKSFGVNQGRVSEALKGKRQ
jgi:hypothetical protein